MAFITQHPFSRQPLSPLSKTTVAALLGLIILCGIMSIFSTALLVTTVIVLLSTVLVAVGIRWAPLLGSLLCGYILYVFLIQEAFPVYHLVHPKDALSSVALSCRSKQSVTRRLHKNNADIKPYRRCFPPKTPLRCRYVIMTY